MTETPLFATPARVRRLQIEITTGCNLRCAGCQRTLGLDAGTWRNTNMPEARFAAILANAPPADAIILQGIGEPTLHPGLPGLIARARADGRFGVVSFNTNALLREPAYYAALRAQGLGHLSISVDSLRPDTAEALRAGTDTARLAAAIPALIDLFQGNVTLSVVLSRRNLAELAALLGDLRAMGARVVEVQPLVSYGPTIDHLALTEPDQARARAIIAAAQGTNFTVLPAAALTPNGSRCRRPFHAVYVTVDGFLTPCCLTNDPDLMGRVNLAETRFDQAWASPGVRRFLASYFDREPAICQGCAFNPAGTRGEDSDRTILAEGQAALRASDPATARDRFQRVLSRDTAIEALHGLGLARLMSADPTGAPGPLRLAHELRPDQRVTHNLAMALEKTGAREEAVALEQANITDHPDYVPAWHGLSAALDALGRHTEAAGVELGLAERAARAGAGTVAETAAARAAMLDPAHARLLETANRLRIAGQTAAAERLLAARLAQSPQDVPALLSRAMSRLVVVHQDVAEIAVRRAAYLADLAAVETALDPRTPADNPAGATIVGTAKPFFLAYQGEDDTDAQRRYGRVVERLMRPRAPAVIASPRRPGPVRVGFATAYFHNHSVSKLFGGWIRGLDPRRFDVFGYHLGEARDAMSDDLARHCVRFHQGPLPDRDWADRILGDGLDVLIYPEIGMHPMPVRLGAWRLAPTQAMAWGHPVTSGLPPVDLFLSADLMEPRDGERHYTERLVRLPNLSIFYQPPTEDGGGVTRAGLGLAESDIVYLCCQSAFKYHPADDTLLAAIGRRVPRARFLFIGDPARDPNAAALRGRLARAFRAAGLNADQTLVFTPPVAAEAFPALLRSADIYLDTPRWSGGNTTLEAMAQGLPIITLPGPMMRGRHSAAILRQAGAEAWIAADAADYVNLAAGLAEDDRRAAARTAILAGRARVFGDTTPIAALETLLETTVAEPVEAMA
jgi:predicted O-linked N-acetylglucosamine transferase (SPINDLY family)/MoaA/NifB/PqqE/SkfB family radical SAM enzyme